MQKFEKAHLCNWPKQLNIREIQQQFGSPLWIVSQDQIKSNIEELCGFTDKTERILYPIKTNPSLPVIQLLAQHGIGADCANAQEVDLALYSGIPVGNISYNSPAQDIELCKQLLKAGGTVVMDDPEAIKELCSELNAAHCKGTLCLRVNLMTYYGYTNKDKNQELMAHGHTSSKFGIPAEEIMTITASLTLPVSGLHVHVGTQMDNIESHLAAIDELHQMADVLRKSGHPIKYLNIGGGLGIPFQQQQNFPSIKYWSRELNKKKRSDFDYYIEPGHALIGNAVVLLAEILAKKQSRGKTWLIADVGTDQLAKVTLLHWPHRVLGPEAVELPKGNDALAGPLCFAGDTLLENIDAGSLKKGDPILITEAGAYTFSLSNKFNGRLAPAWAILTKNQLTLTTLKENRYDNIQFAQHRWRLHPSDQHTQLNTSAAELLSSEYLRTGANSETFDYLRIQKHDAHHYTFEVMTHSKVDFVSMPFLTRIVGDATIISVLRERGYTFKDVAVWGRKLHLDILEKIPSNQSLCFSLSISYSLADPGTTTVVEFHTVCSKARGSLIIKTQSNIPIAHD